MPSSEPRRHHQVPKFYLKRFATRGRVYVRRRDGSTFLPSPENIAVETGFYDTEDASGGRSTEVESMLSRVEGDAGGAMRRIDASNGPPPLGHADREALALFLALQMTRTTEHRERALFVERLVRWAGDRVITKDVVAQYLEQVHLGFAAKDPEIEAAHLVATVTMSEPSVMTQQWAVEMMLTSARELVPRILRLNWTIEIDRHHTFITSDMPIVLWRKPTRRDNYEGLGIANSEELRFSLDPQKVLVLSRRKRQATINVQPHRVSRLNADLASACHRFILGNPDDRATVDAPFMYRIRPVLRFWTGPLFVTGEDGQSRRAEGDVIQQWVPRNDRVGRPQTRTRLT